MLKIKLSRVGKINQAQYRVVVAEARSKRDGKHIAVIGTHDPHTNPVAIKIDKEKYQLWLSKGAQPTETVRKLVKKLTIK